MWEGPGVIIAVIVGICDVRLSGNGRGAYFSSDVHSGMTYKVEYTNTKVICSVLKGRLILAYMRTAFVNAENLICRLILNFKFLLVFFFL
jgi:hypothetical protein